jgi:hypothetical protein
MSEISALIEKLEAAKVGSRELDADIFRIIGLTEAQERHCREWCRMDGRTDLTRDRYIAAWAASFTTSLDAALTLVPEARQWTLESTPRETAATVYLDWERDPYDKYSAFNATPALALSIAALKARSAQ